MSDQPGASTSAPMEVMPEAKTAERDREIEKIMKMAFMVVNRAGIENNKRFREDIARGEIDLDVSDELAGILMTAFTCLRKEENDKAGHDRYKAYTAKLMGADIAIADIVSDVKSANLGLDFKIATPIIEMMTLFRSFFDEVRTGVNKFNVRQSVAKRTQKRDSRGQPISQRKDGKFDPHSISTYGLINHHIPLLQGITLAPERRTGVIRSLGPMTQCILLILEDKYHAKLKASVLYSLQMLPMANEICNTLQNASEGGEVSGLMKELADILVLTTARTTQKMYFPLTLIMYMWEIKRTTPLHWSFCGSGMIKAYTDIVIEKKIIFQMRSGGGALQTSQCVFHAMFGTYLEDLKVLETITSHTGKWSNRKEMNDVFIRRGAAGKIKFTPITFKYVSKMAQALLTKSLGNVDPTATSRPSFAGFRKRNFTAEFLTYLQTGKSAQS